MTQSLAALAVGNQVRLQRSAAKARVKAPQDTAEGMCVLADELEAGRTWPKALRVEEALTWPPRSMPRQRAALLAHAGCSQFTTVAELSGRQVGVLCYALRSPATWRGRA